MKPKSALAIGLTLSTAFFLVACAQTPEAGPVGPAGPSGPQGPPGPPGDPATAGQEYVGSQTCGGCHTDIFAKFTQSGHPHITTKVENGRPPTYPHDSTTGGLPDPPEGYSWEDISFVIGGFGWKARFVDQEGYLITGESAQYNLPNQLLGTDAQWVPYHPGEAALPHDCGACHTTGYSPEGN